MNKIKYFFLRSTQTLKEHGIIYFIKIIVGKILGKNLEFVNLIFKKGNYYFRWSTIGFAMIQNSYEYIKSSSFQNKYDWLIQWLDDEGKKTVDLFIKHINLFYHNNMVHENELFSDREKKMYEKSLEFMGKNWVLHPSGYWLFEDNEILKRYY